MVEKKPFAIPLDDLQPPSGGLGSRQEISLITKAIGGGDDEEIAARLRKMRVFWQGLEGVVSGGRVIEEEVLEIWFHLYDPEGLVVKTPHWGVPLELDQHDWGLVGILTDHLIKLNHNLLEREIDRIRGISGSKESLFIRTRADFHDSRVLEGMGVVESFVPITNYQGELDKSDEKIVYMIEVYPTIWSALPCGGFYYVTVQIGRMIDNFKNENQVPIWREIWILDRENQRQLLHDLGVEDRGLF